MSEYEEKINELLLKFKNKQNNTEGITFQINFSLILNI